MIRAVTYFAIDEVLAGYSDAAIAAGVASELFSRSELQQAADRDRERTRLWRAILTPGFFADLPVIEKGLAAVEVAAAHGPVALVSAMPEEIARCPHADRIAEERASWIRRNLGDLCRQPMIHWSSRPGTTRLITRYGEHTSILVDTDTPTLTAWAAAGGVPVWSGDGRDSAACLRGLFEGMHSIDRALGSMVALV